MTGVTRERDEIVLGPEDTVRAGWLRGVATVAVLELRQRVRSSRWIVVLVIWTALLGLLSLAIRWSVFRALTPVGQEAATAEAGRLVFGLVALLVLSLGALVVPALSATSINGDRNAGILATLQTTLLTPWQIALGKLAASWAVALVLLACAVPFLVFAGLQGGNPVSRIVVAVVIIALTMLVICAIGLGFSSLTARTSSSAVLTYLVTALLGLGLPIMFLIAVPMVTQVEQVTQYEPKEFTAEGVPASCELVTNPQPVAHTERSWWLLAASPYFVLGDASPRPAAASNLGSDPLDLLRTGIREARLGPQPPAATCEAALAQWRGDGSDARAADRDRLGASWAYGLGLDLLLGSAMTLVAVRRLRTPLRRLPRGTRVA